MKEEGRRVSVRVKGDLYMLNYWLFKWRREPQAKVWPLEVGKGKETHFTEVTQPCQHLDFSPLKPISDF